MDSAGHGTPLPRRRVLEIARAVTPPRFLRLYQERATFRNRVRRLLVWSFVPVLVWSFVLADGGLLSIASRRIRVWRLERQVAQLESRRELLLRSIEMRDSDPAVLERLARERYGMARPGETVYRIVEVSPQEGRRIAREQKKLAKLEPPDRETPAAPRPLERGARRGTDSSRRPSR